MIKEQFYRVAEGRRNRIHQRGIRIRERVRERQRQRERERERERDTETERGRERQRETEREKEHINKEEKCDEMNGAESGIMFERER